MMMTKPQADAIAAAVHAVRPDWDTTGVLAALARARERAEPWQVAAAALIAAGNPDNRTPGVIPLAGGHWTAIVVERHVDHRTEPRCEEHPHELAWNCRCCRADEIGAPAHPTRSTEPVSRRPMPRVPTKES